MTKNDWTYEVESYNELRVIAQEWVKKYGVRGRDYNDLRFGQWIINNTNLCDIKDIFYKEHVYDVVHLCYVDHFEHLEKPRFVRIFMS